MADSRHTVYFDLQDVLGHPGGALCTLALRSMRRYFDALGYESVNDPGIRDSIRTARGFCQVHGRMLREARDAQGTAIIHRDVLSTVANTLGRSSSARPRSAAYCGRRSAPIRRERQRSRAGAGAPAALPSLYAACQHGLDL